MKPKPAVRSCLALSGSSLLAISSAHGDNANWTGGGTDALWSNTANWSASPVPGTGNTATFNAAAGAGGAVIDLGAGVTVNTISFVGPSFAAYTIGAGGANAQSLILNGSGNAGFAASGTATTAQITINAALTINNTQQWVLSNGANPWIVNGNVTPNGASGSTIQVKINGRNVTFNGILADQVGGAKLQMAGANATTATLTNPNNSFTGGLYFDNGSVSVSSIGMTGSNSAAGAGGDLLFGSGFGGGSLIYTGTGNTTDRVIKFNNGFHGATITQSGASGMLKFTADLNTTTLGGQTLTLNGSTAGAGEFAGKIADNGTTGSTGVKGATTASTSAVLYSVDGISIGAAITGTGITAGTTITAINPGTRTVTLSAAATLADGATVTIPGVVNNTKVTKSGTGIWTLSNTANTYTGATTVSAGILEVAKLADGGSDSSIGKSSSAAANLVFNTGGVLRYTGSGDSTDRAMTFGSNANSVGFTIDSSGTGAVNFTNTSSITNTQTGASQIRFYTLSGTNTDENTLAATIANNGANAANLTKGGSGKWILTSANSHTGGTFIQAGILEVRSGAGNLTQSIGALTTNVGEATLISNKSGTGTLSTTFSGRGRNSGGSVNIVSTGGTNGTDNSVLITGGAQGFIDKGTFFNGMDFAAQSATNGFVRALAYGTDPSTAAVGTVTASNHVKLDSSYSGAGVSLLSVNLAGSGVGWTNISDNLTVPGIIKSGGGSEGIISGGAINPSNTELVIRTDTASDLLSISSNLTQGTGALTKSGAGKLTLSGTNTYTGQTHVNAGTLSIGANVHLGAQATGATLNLKGGTLQATGTFGLYNGTAGTNNRAVTLLNQSTIDVTDSNTLTIAGVISNNSSAGSVAPGFNKTGTGALVLAATSTYTGDTNVNNGKLLINGSTSAASAFTVNNGGTLGGTGTIGGTVAVNSGATLSPGASIESLGTGSNIWSGGSTFVFEFSTDGSTGTAGTQWDLLAITGNLDLGGVTVLNPVNLDLVTMANATTPGLLGTWDPDVNAVWPGFVSTTAGITGFAANLFNIDVSGFQNATNGTFAVAQSGNNLDLIYTAIPEPRSALLGGLGLLMLLGRRRD